MSVIPDFVGQRYKDTNTGNIWIANSTTPGDWTLEVQDMLINWLPDTLSFGECIGYFTWGPIAGLTNLTFLGTTSLAGFDLEYVDSIVSVQFPNLVSIDPLSTQNGLLYLISNSSLLSVDAPNLVLTTGGIEISENALLQSIDLHSLVSNPLSLRLHDNVSLQDLDLSSFVPANGDELDASGCALNATSVNLILSRHVANASYVTGDIALNGGTSSAPTGQGIADKATLIGRGVSVTTN